MERRDGGIVLCAAFHDVIMASRSREVNSKLAERMKSIARGSSKILELGSGSGIVGLQLAHMCPTSQVLLTDLPLARDILSTNIKAARVPTNCLVENTTLDWAEELPSSITNRIFDLIVVSDCTYNTNSIPVLVDTLGTLMHISPSAMLIIATKVRHESEEVFHGLLTEVGIAQVEHHPFVIPDLQRTLFGQELEKVDIYVYAKSPG